MILVDTALAQREAQGRPLRVGLLGAGFMGAGIALQIERYTPGMRLAAIAARRPEQARAAWIDAGAPAPRLCESPAALADAIAARVPAITEDLPGLAAADGLDAVFDATGSVEVGAACALAAFAAGRAYVSFNAELDATIGAILKRKADAAGVVYALADGDQPGVQLNLARFVRGIGVRPVLCGNIKGLHDVRRTPHTQRAFAEKWGQNPAMVTSFADGTKIAFEQACVANALGFGVLRRGMLGPDFSGGDPGAPLTPIETCVAAFEDALDPAGPGVVDYVVGARPGPGVFVLGVVEDPRQRRFLELYKLGRGPLYCFVTPYHLCHFEVPNAIARAVLFQDATLAPQGPPSVAVVAAAKRDLAAGELLDGFGGFCAYGLAENAATAQAQGLLPMGLAEGCRLKRPIARDAVISRDDVQPPPGRLIDTLDAEQRAVFTARSRAP